MHVFPTLHIQLLGDFHLVYGDQTITGVKTTRLQSLLAYLVLHRKVPQLRQRLAFLFWPDTSEEQARNNLRNLLHFLRRALPDSGRFLLVDTQTIQWNTQAAFTLDVDQFAQSASHLGSRLELQQAIQIYSGDLLPDCYDDWIQPERESLRELFIRALESLIQLLEDGREFSLAISYAQRLLRVEPLREGSHLQLMHLFAAHGERAKALHTYHTCVTLLERELGVEPGLDIQIAYQRLLKAEEQPPIQRLAGTPPLIGRGREWASLQSAWRGTAHGQARFVLVTGEAGIGKTRLAEEMIDWAERQEIATARALCFAAEGKLAYAPVAGLLRSRPLPALEELWLSEVARLVPEVLIEHPELPPPAPLTESWQRLRLFKALALALLKGRSELILLIEDLQWSDRDTIEWIAYLLQAQVEIAPKTPLFVISTMRAGEISDNYPLETLLADLRHGNKIMEIELESLNEDETIDLAESVIGGEVSPAWRERLYQETEGNPLFVVEMARLMQGKELEESQGVIALLSKVQGVIAARLRELTLNAYELAEIAAVIGRQFAFPVLKQAAGREEEHLVNGLEELWRRRIVRERGQEAYDFSHDKIRELVYVSLSTARRKLFHQRVAKALELVYPNELDAVSGQIAAHYERAGKVESAVNWYRQAAQVSQRMYANQAAVDFYHRALAIIEEHADLRAGARLQDVVATINEDLGDILALTRQLDAARSAYQNSLTLVPLTLSIQRARLHRKIGQISPDLKEATKIYIGCEEILDTQADKASSEWWYEWIELQMDRLWNYYRQGRLTEVVDLISKTEPIVEKIGTPSQRIHFFVGLACRDDLIELLEVSDQGVAYLKAALLAARKSGNLIDIAFVQFHLGTLQIFRDEFEDAERELLSSLKLSGQTGDLLLKARCLCSLTFLFRRRGLVEEGRNYVSLALEAAQAARSAYHIAICQANAAWVAWRDGKLEEAKRYGLTAFAEPVFAAEQMVWAALWPLVGVYVIQNRMVEAVEYARRLFACKY